MYSAAKVKELTTKLNNELATLKPGEILYKENLFGEVYHSCDGISSTQIKTAIECLAKYKAKHVDKSIKRETKKVFDLGSAAHSYVLELEKFGDEFVVQPNHIKTRHGAKWDQFKHSVNDYTTIITMDDYTRVVDMANAIQRHPKAKELLSGGMAETSYFKRDEETDLIIKCRPDYKKPGLLVDLKSCADGSEFGFSRNAKKMLYHMSAAMYLDITGEDKFAIVATETSEPHIVTAPIFFDEDALKFGYFKYRQALKKIESCMLFDTWPNYTDQPVEISLNRFELEELEELTENLTNN